MSNTTRFQLALAATFSLLLSIPAQADGDDDNPAVEYRHDVMEKLGSNAAALVAVLTGKVSTPGHLKVHADTLAQSATLIADLFPDESKGGHALPLIWEEPDKVAAAAQASVDATAALAAAVNGGDRAAAMQAFRDVGDSCKGCHERYKEDHD